MFFGLTRDFVDSGRKWAAWADFGWLIDPEMHRARTGETCRSCISIYDTLMLALGSNLRSFLVWAGSATTTAATGCTFNLSVKIG